MGKTKNEVIIQDFFITDYENYKIASELYGQPFVWLLKILKNMTGFEYPSGYTLINPRTKTITSIWAGCHIKIK